MQKKEKSDNKKKTKKSSGIGLALWAVAALIILILFIANQNKIATNLKATGFFNKAGLKTPEFVEKAEEPETVQAERKNKVEPIGPVEIDLNSTVAEPEKTEAPVIAQNAAAKKQQEETQEIIKEKETPKTPAAEIIAEEPAPAEKTAKTAQPAKKETVKKESPKAEKKETVVKKEVSVSTPSVKKMKLKLFFMIISSNGTVARKEVVREMKKSDSPLVDAIHAIIAGPDASEEKNGCRTLISSGTKLIGASVKNGIATLNFSGEFEFNQYGIEGLRGQLQQIVYTATAFPTVEGVQFLVDGERKEYLGQEGVWIGTPLGRNSF
ncbi:MAG: GerMN domain-containing protein [Treponema sp.]|nr:GerMN domain-containing protein [Spirochaetia bacterium]MDD7460147.1 GerMN domain-containing protein [Spirochaetales bacterium]MDY5810910.1 GerMN domain-containing protein [Treponema sp.]MEE1181544.1 GerMN domain-containing protein [Treponema sp.]